MTDIKWGRPDYSGVTSKCGEWYIQASRDIHDKPISWSIFDNTKPNQWLDDRLAERPTLSEAKEYVDTIVEGREVVCDICAGEY